MDLLVCLKGQFKGRIGKVSRRRVKGSGLPSSGETFKKVDGWTSCKGVYPLTEL